MAAWPPFNGRPSMAALHDRRGVPGVMAASGHGGSEGCPGGIASCTARLLLVIMGISRPTLMGIARPTLMSTPRPRQPSRSI